MSKARVIDGIAIGKKLKVDLEKAIRTTTGRPPLLAVILIGDNAASSIYVKSKQKACGEVGIKSMKLELPAEVSEEELITHIESLNNNENVDGILVQMPLPPHINPAVITNAVSPDKDIDGFHPLNMGKLLQGRNDGFIPCTPLGICHILISEGISVSGKHAVILGRSDIVGKPMAGLLMQRGLHANATVTVAHSKTEDLPVICRSADILIAAIGKPCFVDASMVKKGAIVIDVGINRVEDKASPKGYRIVGDVDYNTVINQCSVITPVPGGVGPMTIAMLLYNTLKSYMRRYPQCIDSSVLAGSSLY